MKQKFLRLWQIYVPRSARICAAVALFAAAIHIVALCSPAFADVFQRYVASLGRGALGLLTGWIPFSLAELLVVLIPLWFAGLVFLAVRLSGDAVKTYRMLARMVAAILLLYALFVFTFGLGYLTTPLSERLELASDDPSAEELRDTTLYLTEQLVALENEMQKNEKGESVMPYSYREMNRRLLSSYAALAKEHSFLSRLPVGTKRVLLSRPMTYTGITGVYTFFTGEANVNTTYPDYATAFTAAHEMAHQRGIAREDEANFIAFLACVESEDAFLRYAGYLNMLQYMLGALYQADREAYLEIARAYPTVVRLDLLAYNAVYDAFDGSLIGDISEGVNDSYLQIMGTEGTASYSLVTRLCVAYLRPVLE